MKPSSLPIAALAAAAITSAHAAKPPQVGDIITLQVQTLACFDLENTKELERTRAMRLQPLRTKRHNVPGQKGLRLDERRAYPVLY